MKILVTGGTGYIGSHTVVQLLENNYEVVIVDNLSNSSKEVIDRIEKITNNQVDLHTFDLENIEKLDALFIQESFDAVVHFAGLKAVAESNENPLRYYRTNLDSTLSLLEAMQKNAVKKLVFSSSATVYGSASTPYEESDPTGQNIANTYGRTKYFVEQILQDTANSDSSNEFTSLRYFNPIGAHESGLIGEDPSDIPNNLMPFLAQVAVGKREKLSIFGNDYETVDGTGVRDFIHVMDLAKGHIAALEHSQPGHNFYNLGSGHGTSVLELIHAFETSTGVQIPYEILPRRSGDLPEYYADVSKSLKELGWKTEKTIEDACKDTWRWQSNNPNGFTEDTTQQ